MDVRFFKKNNLTLAAPPIGVIVFPGSDIVANLADIARKMGNPVWSFTKGGARARFDFGVLAPGSVAERRASSVALRTIAGSNVVC